MRAHYLIRTVRSVFLLAAIAGMNVHAADETANLTARMAKLERALDNRGLLDLLQQVERLQDDVKRLRGQVEDQAYTIDQLRKTQRDSYVDIDQRLQALQGGGIVAGGAAGEASAPPLTTLQTGEPGEVAGTAPSSSLQLEMQGEIDEMIPPATPREEDIAAVDTDPVAQPAAEIVPRPSLVAPGPTVDNEASEKAYRDAFSLLKAGQYDESINAFSAFLAQFPNSQYADNAQYWLGETYYVKRQFEPALAEYSKLIRTYPESKKQSHAMLKIGYSYHELGQADQARAVLEDLRNRFPGTTAARLAEERIQILGRN